MITTPLKHISSSIGYIMQIIDITELERARRKLLEEKELSDAIIDTDHTIIVGLDKQCTTKLFNKGAEKITGYSKSEVLGKNWNTLFLNFENKKSVESVWESAWKQNYNTFSHAIQNDSLQDKAWNADQKNNIYTVTGPLQIKDGTIKTILWQNTKIHIGDNENKHLHLSIGLDITNLKKMEAQLYQTQKMEAIGKLAGGIAHDFNNILSIIIGNTEILLDDISNDSSFKSSINEIYMAAIRAKDLVLQILTFSRQETSKPILIKIQPIIEEALKFIRSTISTGISINQDIHPNCSTVKAIPIQIHQIIINLATNAYHAMENTGGELKVSLKEIELNESDVFKLPY